MDNNQTAVVIQRSIEGVPIRTIAQEIGTSHVSVVRARSKPEVKAHVEAGITALMMRGLTPARRTLCRMAAMGTVKGQDKDMLKLALDASKVILSHAQGAPGTVINTLIQINSGGQEQLQELSGISAFLQSQWSQDKTIDLQPAGQGNDR